MPSPSGIVKAIRQAVVRVLSSRIVWGSGHPSRSSGNSASTAWVVIGKLYQSVRQIPVPFIRIVTARTRLYPADHYGV